MTDNYTDLKPYTPPAEPYERPAHLVTKPEGLEKVVPLLTFIVAAQKDKEGYGTKSYSPFLYTELYKDAQTLDILEQSGVKLEQNPSLVKEKNIYYIVSCDLNNPNITPPTLNSKNRENIARTAEQFHKQGKIIKDILLKHYNDGKDPYDVIHTVDSILKHIDAINQRTLDAERIDFNANYRSDMLGWLLGGAILLLADNTDMGYELSENALTEDEKKQLSAAAHEMTNQYRQTHEDVNAGLHQLLYAQAQSALEIERERPSGCLAAPFIAMKNAAIRLRGDREG